jgi:pilus assembly protein Flp/PilA
MATIKRFMTDESGATAAEYALLVALIGAVIIIAVTTLGGNLNAMYNTVAADIGAAS